MTSSIKITPILETAKDFIEKIKEITLPDGTIQWEKKFRMICEQVETENKYAKYDKIVYNNGLTPEGKLDERYLKIAGIDEKICGRILPLEKDLIEYKTFINAKDNEIIKPRGKIDDAVYISVKMYPELGKDAKPSPTDKISTFYQAVDLLDQMFSYLMQKRFDEGKKFTEYMISQFKTATSTNLVNCQTLIDKYMKENNIEPYYPVISADFIGEESKKPYNKFIIEMGSIIKVCATSKLVKYTHHILSQYKKSDGTYGTINNPIAKVKISFDRKKNTPITKIKNAHISTRKPNGSIEYADLTVKNNKGEFEALNSENIWRIVRRDGEYMKIANISIKAYNVCFSGQGISFSNDIEAMFVEYEARANNNDSDLIELLPARLKPVASQSSDVPVANISPIDHNDLNCVDDNDLAD